MKRREFLSKGITLGAGAAFAPEYHIFARQKRKNEAPDVKIGILSDIHITSPDSTGLFRHALELFRDAGVDGVMVAGDLADHGLELELVNVTDTWKKVFPGDKAPDGRHVEPMFIYGNHDVSNWAGIKEKFPTEEEYNSNAIYQHREASWKNYFGEEFQPVYIKNVKGYDFVGAHWKDENCVEGLAEFFEKNHDRLAGKKPFFYFQHAHPKDTCNGPDVWGHDDGTSTEILRGYPNAIVFSGHSHTILNDERTIWQGEFTSVGTASLLYTFHEDDTDRFDSHQGMIMSVYDDFIALERLEFTYDEHIGDDWIVPAGTKKRPLTFKKRAGKAIIPQFNAEDKVTVSDGLTRILEPAWVLYFPNVLERTHGTRAFCYKVRIEKRENGTISTVSERRMFSEHYFLSDEHAPAIGKIAVRKDMIPSGVEVRFTLWPCESFGGTGRPIMTGWLIPE